MKIQTIIFNAVNYLLFSKYLQMFLHAFILLYLIILNNSCCVKTSNIVLDHMFVVNLCVGSTS